MHGQRKLAEFGRRGWLQPNGFEAFGRAPESAGQGEVLIGITQLPEQAPHSAHAPLGLLNEAQRVRHCGAARFHALEQPALEFPAVFWPLRINSAAATLKGGAWLDKTRRAAFWGWTLRVSVGALYGQAERLIPSGALAALQFDIGKNDTVATQAAGQADILGCGHTTGKNKTERTQSTYKLGENRQQRQPAAQFEIASTKPLQLGCAHSKQTMS